MPGWVGRALAIAMAVFFLISFGGAILASSPEPAEVSAALRSDADGKQSPEEVRELALVKARAEALQEEASSLSAGQSKAGSALREVRSRLHQAERELVRAQSDARHYTRRLAAISARNAREAEELAEIETEEAEPVEEESSGCDPNYTGCVPDTGYDVDCSEVAGPVEVIGSDVDGLDADGDGIGCES
jgi:hypothetical protein